MSCNRENFDFFLNQNGERSELHFSSKSYQRAQALALLSPQDSLYISVLLVKEDTLESAKKTSHLRAPRKHSEIEGEEDHNLI